MAVRIFTDSACDLEFSELEALQVELLRIPVFFDEERYIEGENLTREEFYEKLAVSERLPKTAQITPVEFEEAFRPYVEAGEEIVVRPWPRSSAAPISPPASQRSSFPRRSSRWWTPGRSPLVWRFLSGRRAALRDAGHTGPEIAEQIGRLAARVRLYAVIDDLKYLRLGGRLSSAGAVLGTLLGIKPIISVQDGQVVCVHKVRGQKAGCAYVLERAGQEGIDPALPGLLRTQPPARRGGRTAGYGRVSSRWLRTDPLLQHRPGGGHPCRARLRRLCLFRQRIKSVRRSFRRTLCYAY